MNSKFYKVEINDETEQILQILKEKGFSKLENTGEEVVFIDNENKVFWYCSIAICDINAKNIRSIHKEEVETLTLKRLK
jgi:hypothetical protein